MNDQQSTEKYLTVDDSADAIRAALKANYPPMDDEELSELWSAAILDRPVTPADIPHDSRPANRCRTFDCKRSVVDDGSCWYCPHCYEQMATNLAAADGEIEELRDLLLQLVSPKDKPYNRFRYDAYECAYCEAYAGDRHANMCPVQEALDLLSDVPAVAEGRGKE